MQSRHKVVLNVDVQCQLIQKKTKKEATVVQVESLAESD